MKHRANQFLAIYAILVAGLVVYYNFETCWTEQGRLNREAARHQAIAESVDAIATTAQVAAAYVTTPPRLQSTKPCLLPVQGFLKFTEESKPFYTLSRDEHDTLTIRDMSNDATVTLTADGRMRWENCTQRQAVLIFRGCFKYIIDPKK